MTLEEIKEQVASDDNFHNWESLFESCAMFDYGRLESAIDKVAQRFAQSRTRGLQEQNTELVRMLIKCKSLCETLKVHVVAKEIEGLLTEYNHLKLNTNETDKI